MCGVPVFFPSSKDRTFFVSPTSKPTKNTVTRHFAPPRNGGGPAFPTRLLALQPHTCLATSPPPPGSPRTAWPACYRFYMIQQTSRPPLRSTPRGPPPPGGTRPGQASCHLVAGDRTGQPQLPTRAPARSHPPLPPLPPSDRARCAALLAHGCHDCGAPTRRKTVNTAPLVVRLCFDCARGYNHTRAAQRLQPKSSALFEWRLRPVDLEPLPYAIDVNSINPNFAPMRLFRWGDVRVAAVARWGAECVDAKRRVLVPYSGGSDGEG